ncbi:hypothetical protein A3J90_03010 [candidate division WOR-1 bacterium RIFOXYC2_FULL_37_10]|nr:MAG: hypothetical protein A3J90_03010 [candidate division WOR-1 bacterium RIFOXYC2_FULL_37_10]
MKKIFLLLLSVLLFVGGTASFAISFKDFDEQGVSLKAGPTDAVENLSIAWVETALYPKNVEKGREIFVEVKLTSKMERVFAELDFGDTSEKVELSSSDGFSWTNVSKTPMEIKPGSHLAKITIENKKGKQITRTLDFAVLPDTPSSAQAPEFDVTALTDVYIVKEGGEIKKLSKGEKVTALFKAPFYRVKLDNGTEGWIEASKVNEPTEEFYLKGYKFYSSRDYKMAEIYYLQAVRLDPSHTKARYWLAKSYIKQGKNLLAKDQLKEVLAQNSNFPGARELASLVVEDYYSAAERDIKNKEYKKALISFNNIVDINPGMISAWIRIGETYRAMGLQTDAKVAWREALKIDPEDKQARLLLGYKDNVVTASIEKHPRVVVASSSKVKNDLTSNKNSVSEDFVKKSIQLVQNAKTSRGTEVASAIKSVMALTKSLGTKINEDGWKVSAVGNGFLVQYACRQERKGRIEAENFDWKIDPDTRRIMAINDNSKLLMSRW